MLAQSATVPLPAPARASYVVDLIGDLDTYLARSFAETMERLGPSPGQRIVVHLKHVGHSDAVGLAVFGLTLGALRRTGCDIAVVAQGKRVRTLLRAARIDVEIGHAANRSALVRHMMIVRNSDSIRDCA